MASSWFILHTEVVIEFWISFFGNGPDQFKWNGFWTENALFLVTNNRLKKTSESYSPKLSAVDDNRNMYPWMGGLWKLPVYS
jgi:hypothetical protein